MSPGNENVVTCYGALYKREQKTLQTERRPALFAIAAGEGEQPH
jgi:hypothetical protein